MLRCLAMVVSDVGKRIRSIRKRALLSARALSLSAGFSHSVVAQIESGRIRRPSLDAVERLAEALGVTVADLISDANT